LISIDFLGLLTLQNVKWKLIQNRQAGTIDQFVAPPRKALKRAVDQMSIKAEYKHFNGEILFSNFGPNDFHVAPPTQKVKCSVWLEPGKEERRREVLGPWITKEKSEQKKHPPLPFVSPAADRKQSI